MTNTTHLDSEILRYIASFDSVRLMDLNDAMASRFDLDLVYDRVCELASIDELSIYQFGMTSPVWLSIRR